MIRHWIDLRQRLLRCVYLFIALFVLAYAYSDRLLAGLLMPLLNHLNAPNQLVLTQLAAPILLPIETAANVALLLTLPFALFQFWQFAAPGLYHNERQRGQFYLASSLLLFLLGSSFCLILILPHLFHFLLQSSPKNLTLMLDAKAAIEMIFQMTFIFGLSFQLPLICVFLVAKRWLSFSQLKSLRRYVIVGAFVLGMFLAPPDVWSQTLMALPLWGLYELGLTACWFYNRKEELEV